MIFTSIDSRIFINSLCLLVAIFFVNEIPKGATGKLQRNTLAKKFGLVN